MWKVALQHGYLEGRKETILKNQRNASPKIAILCPEIVSIFYTRRATEITKHLEDKGASVQIFICDFGKENAWKSVRKCLESMEIDGIVSLTRDDFEQDIMLPYICVSSSDRRRCVYPDFESGMTAIIALAKKRGHTRFAFLGEMLTDSKESNYNDAIVQNGIAQEASTIVNSHLRFEDAGYDDMRTLLEMSDRPTFCVCAYDEIAIGAMKALRERGIRVPDDMAIVGINNIPAAQYTTPQLSSMGCDEEALSEAVAEEILQAVLSDTPQEVKKICVPYKFYLRETFS